jgi:hypothetical protein
MNDEKTNLEQALIIVQKREVEYESALHDEAEKEHIFKMKQASEFLSASGSVDARKMTALVKCKIEHQAYLKATAVKEFTREKLRDAQSAVSARQSLFTAQSRTNFGQSYNQMNA